MNIIALTGNPRSGKDTCAKILANLFKCNIYSFGAPLREYIESRFGVDYEKFKDLQLSHDISGRDIVNAIAEFPKTKHIGYFSDIVIDDMSFDPNEYAIISDLRFDSEHTDLLTLEIVGDKITVVEVLNNSSELICRDKFFTDYTINNTSDLEALQKSCNELYNTIIGMTDDN